MGSIVQDIRHSWRSLVRVPAFSLASLLTLALGIGATAAIFSVTYGVLLRPLPYPAADRLFVLAEPGSSTLLSGQIFHQIRDRVRTFENVAARGGVAGWNLSDGNQAEHVNGMSVSRGYFDVVGVRPAIGRGFTVAEDQPSAPRAVILADALWRRSFGAKADVIGQSIQLGGVPHAIVGVMPPGFWQTPAVDLWTPLRASPTNNAFNYTVVARLRPDVSEAEAAAELDAMRWTLQREVQDLSVSRAGSLRWTALQEYLGFNNRDALVLLTAAVAFLLLIACVNVASLQLVRGLGRRREMATRAALGGGRARLVRQVLTESVLLAVGGGVLGVLLARFGLEALLSSVPRGLVGNHDIALDWRVAGVVLAVSVGAGILFGLAPAFNVARLDVRTALWEGGRHTASRSALRLRQILTGGQVALAVVLLVAAGLLIRSFVNLTSAPLGFDASNVVIGRMSLQGSASQMPAGAAAFFDRALADLQALPGVASVAVANNIPVERGVNLAIHPPAGGILKNPRVVDWRWVSAGYFAVFGIPVRDGRTFEDGDQAKSTPVAVVNEAFARLFFGRPRVVGEIVRLMGSDPPRQIVGVVADVKGRPGAGWTSGMNALAAPAPPIIYVPLAQVPDSRIVGNAFFPMSWAVRTRAADASVAQAIRRIVQSAAPQLPFLRFESMQDVIAADLETQRFLMALFAAFASAALSLAVIGMYGLTAYAVGQRTHEVGIRMALGASSALVLRRFLAEGLTVVMIGLGVGLIGAALTTRMLQSMIFAVTVQDSVTLVGVSATLLSIAGLATLIPSLRAARINPASAMRAE